MGLGKRGRWALASLAITALSGGVASAATLTVNTTLDEVASGDGLCSLREAITAVDSPGTATDCGKADT